VRRVLIDRDWSKEGSPRKGSRKEPSSLYVYRVNRPRTTERGKKDEGNPTTTTRSRHLKAGRSSDKEGRKEVVEVVVRVSGCALTGRVTWHLFRLG
jgi:hypothetical protein